MAPFVDWSCRSDGFLAVTLSTQAVTILSNKCVP